MAYYVISGKPDCPHFTHAIHVARYLNEKLPNFQFNKVEKLSLQWTDFIAKLNKENKWYITNSPVIWKEINMWGGKKYLIGGLSEFWEYVYCYYGLESVIPKHELEKLAADNLKFFIENKDDEAEKLKLVRHVSILGACNPQTPILIQELSELKELKTENGIFYKLYYSLGAVEQRTTYMRECADYINNQHRNGSGDAVTVVSEVSDAIKEADIVIHVEDFRKNEAESTQAWLQRCYSSMNHLADVINEFANHNLRIVMNNHGPVCFLATCLMEKCTKIKPCNIVAVTANEGLSVISVISEKTGIHVSKICGPPVWGFVGIESFVDERNIVFKADMRMPYARALTAPVGSTLPLGTLKTELRLISYMLSDEDISKEVEMRKEKMHVRLDRPSILSKIRALTSLLKLWYANEDSEGSIISLGVCSNGSFGIPTGIVFSQPVKLDEERKWTPYEEFPLMNDSTRNQIQKCIDSATEIMRQFGVVETDLMSETGSMYTHYSAESLN